MIMKNNENGTNMNNHLSSWDIGEALRELYDTFERIMHNGVLLGEVAKQIKEEKRDGLDRHIEVSEIEWGLPKKNLTPEVASLFKTWGFTPTETGYEYKIGNVPVKIRVYSRKYKFLENLDVAFYGVDEFRLPNPFNTYWKVRNLIK